MSAAPLHQSGPAPEAVLGTPEDVESRDLRDPRWLIGGWVLVLVFGTITLLWSHHVDVPLRDPSGRLFTKRLSAAAVLLVAFIVLEAVAHTLRTGRGWRGVPTRIRDRWWWRRLAVAASGLLAYHLVYTCYRNLKSWNAFRDQHDGPLLDLDKWLFLGHSPAVLVHDLLGEGAAAPVLAFVYTSFTHLVPVLIAGGLVFPERARDGYVFLTSGLWIWILGTATYYLVPAIGPFFSAPAEFEGLRRTRISGDQVEYIVERDHFLAAPGAGDAFASIGAFASLHTGVTCLAMLLAWWAGWRRTSVVLGVYLALVMVATVYFGWHYVVDDVAGVLIAWLSLLFARWMVYPRGRPSSEVPA